MMSDQPAPVAQIASVRHFVVLSFSVEARVDGEPFSAPRLAVGFTVHSTYDAALSRLLFEIEYDPTEVAALACRRSILVQVDVPETMMAGGAPNRWISDRIDELARRGGYARDEALRAFATGRIAEWLRYDLADMCQALSRAMAAGEDEGRTLEIARIAMEAAGAVARAARHGSVGSDFGVRMMGAVREIGATAWEGASTEPLKGGWNALERDLAIEFGNREAA